MSINLTDEILVKTKKGKAASAKQVFLEGDTENLQQIGDKTHQLEKAVKDISVSGGASTANAVSYDNAASGMTAVTTQAALDELAANGKAQASAVAAKNAEQDAEISKKANSADVSSQMQSEQTRVNAELDKKFDKTSIAQEFGDATDKVVSQSALPFREIESPEFIYCLVDAADHLLFGIQLDGSVEWGAGIPSPVRAKLQELADKIQQLVLQSQQDKSDLTAALDAAKTELSSALQQYMTTTDASITALQQNKVDKEEGKSLIDDEVKECFKVIENDEFIHAITDSEDRLLFGIYRDSGKPYFPLNEMYHVEQNEEFFAVWLDADDRVLLGIRRDGEIIGEIHAVNALKQVISQLQSDLASLQQKVSTVEANVAANGNSIASLQDSLSTVKTNLQTFLDIFSLQDNPEFLAVETDADGRVLSSTSVDGSHYAYNMQSETVDAKVDKQEGKSLINSDVADAQSAVEDPEGRMEITTDADNKVLGYRDSDGVRHESGMEVEQFYQKGNKVEYVTKSYVDTKPISEFDGVVDYSLENLFDKTKIRTYDSDFATKVFNAIGRKTGDTGCYSNNIPCKEGDWFTRNDFGTGIVVVLDKSDNILGDVKNVAYKPTFQIKAAEGQDFSKAASVVMVVMLNALDTERIVNAKYVPTKEEDAIRIPKLKVGQENIELGITTYVKGSSGRYYSLNVDDSGDSPQISLVKLDGIPSSELPSDFPKFTVSGDFSEYYKSLVLCPISGGTEYLFELGTNGLVSRYLKKKVNCPRLIKENGVQYYYGVDGNLNSSSGELNIYKAKDETFELVKGNVRDTEGNKIEPHDCLVLSVNPLHVISQRYVGNQKTIVDGEEKTVTSLHVEEQYDGKRVWLWKSEDYPELWKDSHYKGNNEDYLHNNTICIDKDKNLVLNNKQANQILVIARTWSDDTHTGTIGNILWKIGGNQGNGYNYDVETRIKTTIQQQWYECHDAVVNTEGLYTLFDNKVSGASRIVEFNIDTENKVVKNFDSFTYKSYRGRYMGSVDKLADGIFLVSWGSFRSTGTPNIGIYDFKNDKKIFEMKMDSDSYSTYRVYGIRK